MAEAVEIEGSAHRGELKKIFLKKFHGLILCFLSLEDL